MHALIFEGDQTSRALSDEEIAALAPISDEDLLWLDLSPAEKMPLALSGLGLDRRQLDPRAGGELGVVVRENWRYLYVRALNWQGGGRPTALPMVVAIGPNIVVTSHADQVEFLEGVWRNETDYLRVGRMPAPSFAAALLDRMLTDYLDARDDFESQLDRLEIQILRRPKAVYLQKLQALRHHASRLREYLAAQRDLFDALGRPDFDPCQPEEVSAHIQALSRRYSEVMSAIEAARELVNGSFDLYTSRAAESTNEAMHTLTVITVVMGLAATICGLLGMNFEAPLFEAGERGFLIATSIIGLMMVGVTGWALWRHFGRRPPR